jgi:UDP-N-acetylmuramoyl-tripeptide--D-alanyl-D-alanine ligase
MQGMSLPEIAEAVSGELRAENDQLNLFDSPRNVSIDSRTIKNKELFIAIVGERFDGHDYVSAAFASGAMGAIVNKHWIDEKEDLPRSPLIVVEDTLLALQELAKYYRSKFPIPLIAVTGSNGKTTTKEMIASILSTTFCVLKSEGNFNNHLGVPLTLLRLNSQHQMIVLEMGMNHFGEIARLCEIATPEIGVITTVAAAHLEFFHNIQEIAMAKSELIQSLPEDGVAFLNADNEYVMGTRHLTKAAIQTFAVRHAANHKVKNYITKENGGFRVTLEDGFEFELNIIGKHNIHNALGAISVARLFNISAEKIAKQLANFSSTTMRMQRIQSNGIEIINDAYNSNPDSASVALETLREIPTDHRKIVVLGDMLELGEDSERLHYEIGEKVADLEFDQLITVGKQAKNIVHGAKDNGMSSQNTISCEKNKEAIEYLKSEIKPGDMILIKGSRGMKMEEIVEKLME